MADVSKINVNNTEYNIKDTTARSGLNDKQNVISDLADIRSGAALGATAVQPEAGKGLSSNDFTSAEKTKLAGIADGAEVNVQSDWLETTTSSSSYILNKPILGTAATKDATDVYDATGNDVMTGKAVAAALATLPEPMVFKGSLGTDGTISSLPIASNLNKGFTYKVITDGEYASQAAKVGDTFISDGSSWALIPSGDEPSGTVTSVAVVGGSDLNISGSPVTSSGTIYISHSNIASSDSEMSIKKFVCDVHGHIISTKQLSTSEWNVLTSGIDATKVGQIETNKNDIAGVKDGTSIDSFGDVETALNRKVDEVSGKGLSTNDYTTAEKEKLAGIETQANKTVVDDALSNSSTNPVQNKVVKSALDSKQNTLTTAQLAAVNSGITSTDVEQITENENNILWNTNQGVKNFVNVQKPSTATRTNYLPLANGGVELSCTNAQWTSYAIADISVAAGQTYIIKFMLDESSGTSNFYFFLRENDSSGSNLGQKNYGGTTGEYVNEFTPSTNVIWLGIYLNNSATSRTATAKVRCMITSKSLYNADHSYQPYAMSNAELTAAIQALQAQLANQ